MDQSAQTNHPDGRGAGRPVRAVENTQRDRRREFPAAVFITAAASGFHMNTGLFFITYCDKTEVFSVNTQLVNLSQMFNGGVSYLTCLPHQNEFSYIIGKTLP